jgi:S-adenosylmethionine/arginine decarboxylase-like enzyme
MDDQNTKNVSIHKKDGCVLGYHTMFSIKGDTFKNSKDIIEKVEACLVDNLFTIVHKISSVDNKPHLWFLSESHCRIHFRNDNVDIDLFCCGERAKIA